MSGHIRLTTIIAAYILLAGSTIVTHATPASATPPTALQFIVGDGILVAGPDVTVAPNGNRITMTGHGILSLTGIAAEGFGSYAVTNSKGNLLSIGTWTVLRAERKFVSFGTLPGFPLGFQGGQSLLEIQFQDISQHRFLSELLVTCLIGSPPPNDQEGVHLRSPVLGTFNDSISGQTLFIQLI